MSRLIESTLTGKISNILIEAEGKSFKEKLTESAKRCLTEKAWIELKSGAELRKAIDECDETEIEDLRHVLDILKSCCVEAKSLCKDEYDANGFQNVIDDIEMIYDDEDLDQSSVDWELDGFFDLCDSADIFVSLRESKEVKPIEKTRDELIRDHGTDDVDLINAGKEPEERVALKETKGFVDNIGKIADFIIDYDLYGFRNEYADGDDDAKRDALIKDIAKDRKSVAKYLSDITKDENSTEEQVSKANELLDVADLRQFLNEEVEEPTAEDLEKEDEENKAHNKKAIEDRIGELRVAIADGVSDDEKEEMEKEIAELENQLNESSLNEDITVITPENEAEARKYLYALYQSKSDYESDRKYHHGYTKSEYQFQKSEIKRMEKLLKDYEKGLKSEGDKTEKLTEDSYEEDIFKDIEDALVDAGFDVQRYTDAGMMTNNLGWVISNSEGEVQLTCAGTYLSEGTLKESANGTSLSRIEELANYLNSFVNYMKEHNVEEVKLDYSHLAGDCLSVAGEGYLPLSSDFDPDYMDDEYMQEYIAEGSLKESSFETPCVDDGSELAKKYNLRVTSKRNTHDTTTPFTCTFTGNRQDIENMIKTEFNTGDEKLNKKILADIKESVSVVTSDGSTVDTQDAASVQSNDGSVTVVTGDTTVVINNNPTEPALDIPQEEPVEEVPVEEPIEDELTEADEDQDSVISVKSLSVVKNQGNVFMLTYKDSNDNEQYVVCEDFNNETNEGNEAETYSNKDDADKDYFARLDVNTEE